jgi:hypothetical protein
MGISEKMWEGISRVIRMDTKVESLSRTSNPVSKT